MNASNLQRSWEVLQFAACIIAGAIVAPHGSACAEASPIAIIESLPTTSTAAGRAIAEQLLAGGPSALDQLFATLQPTGATPSDVNTRFAIQALASHVSRQNAVKDKMLFNDALLKALGTTPDTDIKIYLLLQLEFSGTKDSAAALLPLLSDPKLVYSASRAMLQLNPQFAATEFPRALQSATTETRTMLLQALGYTRSAAVIELAAPYATNADANTRLTALTALADTGLPAARQYLPVTPPKNTSYVASKEFAAVLQYARRLAESGHGKEAVDIVSPFAQLPAQAGMDHVQCAALGCLIEILGSDAQRYLIEAVDSPSREIRAAALRHAQRLKGDHITVAWISKLKSVPTEVRAEIIAMLAARGDKSANSAVQAALSDEDTTVRIAAVLALPHLAGKRATGALLSRLHDSDSDESKLALKVLATIPGKSVNQEIASRALKAPVSTRANLIDLLAARGAVDQREFVFNAANDTETTVRVAALKAAEKLSLAKDEPRLLDLLLASDSQAEQALALKAVAAAGRATHDSAARIKPLRDRWDKADVSRRDLLLQAAARLGGPEGIAFLASNAITGDDKLRESAVRLLAESPEPEAIADLLQITREVKDETQQVLAIRGILRLAAAQPPDAQLATLKQSLQSAHRTDEKKLVVAAIGGSETSAALELLTPLLNDEQLKTDAAEAIYRITVPQNEKDTALSGDIATASLRQSLPLLKEIAAVRRGRGRLAKLLWNPSSGRAEPDEFGFVSLFNGKDLTGWIGATTSHTVEKGILVCLPDHHGNLFTEREYSDFHFKFEYRLPPGGNNGIGIRSGMDGEPAFQAMEVQILDDSHDRWKGLQPWQLNAGIYGVAAAKPGHAKPAGEWNAEEIIANGDHIEVLLNGEQVVDVNLNDVASTGTVDKQPHPGLVRKSGHIGLLGHGDRVEFRNITIADYSTAP